MTTLNMCERSGGAPLCNRFGPFIVQHYSGDANTEVD